MPSSGGPSAVEVVGDLFDLRHKDLPTVAGLLKPQRPMAQAASEGAAAIEVEVPVAAANARDHRGASETTAVDGSPSGGLEIDSRSTGGTKATGGGPVGEPRTRGPAQRIRSGSQERGGKEPRGTPAPELHSDSRATRVAMEPSQTGATRSRTATVKPLPAVKIRSAGKGKGSRRAKARKAMARKAVGKQSKRIRWTHHLE